jgi:hypothetical protein
MISDDYFSDDVTRENERENHVFIPNFGINHLSIRQASELIPLDMWYSGEILDVGEPNDWDGSEYDVRLTAALDKYVQYFEKKLLNALELGRLNCVRIRRNLDEQIIVNETYIEFSELHGWLKERGYDAGDIIHERWITETDIAVVVSKEVNYLRAFIKENRSTPNTDIDFQALYKKAVLENQSLTNENQQLKKQIFDLQAHQQQSDLPVSTLARKSFLLIIAAFCKKNDFDPQVRGTAGKIQRLVEVKINKTITDDTIKKILDQIQNVLD